MLRVQTNANCGVGRHPRARRDGHTTQGAWRVSSARDAANLLLDDHVHLVLVIDAGGRLLTTIDRTDIRPPVPADTLARTLGTLEGRTVGPETSAAQALTQLQQTSRRRLAVTDEARILIGLLCLKRHGNGFCSDDDVRSRQARNHQGLSAMGLETAPPTRIDSSAGQRTRGGGHTSGRIEAHRSAPARIQGSSRSGNGSDLRS